MKHNLSGIFIILLIFISSCKKDESKDLLVTKYDTYSALKTGNYWIYQRYDVDTNGVETPLNEFDSCYVEKDTLIGGKTYFKVVKPERLMWYVQPYLYLRDSLDCVVDHQGSLVFSPRQKEPVYYYYTYETSLSTDTLYHTIATLDTEERWITVPAGTFLTHKITTQFIWKDPAGRDKIYYTRYAKNIGLVVEFLPGYVRDIVTHQRRLVRYHVELAS